MSGKNWYIAHIILTTFYDSNEFFHSFLGKTMNETYKTYGSKNVKKCHFSLSTFKGYLSGTQNPKFFKIRRALSKNSTTIELLKCIEIGLTKAYIKAGTVADTRNSCPQQNPQCQFL